jgi:hypothetical protein
MTARKTNVLASLRRTALIALAIFGIAFFATTANASCFDHARGASGALPNGLIAKLAASPSAANGSIIGLWHVTYTTSDNQPFQESFDAWHSDGTEEETANVNPIPGNFCVGVWKQVGSEIHLHHVGWSFDNVGNLVGPFTVDQIDALGAHGNSYSGSFDFKQYDTDGNVLFEVTGTIAATRIGVN